MSDKKSGINLNKKGYQSKSIQSPLDGKQHITTGLCVSDNRVSLFQTHCSLSFTIIAGDNDSLRRKAIH